MAPKPGISGKSASFDQLSVQLIPVTDQALNDPARLDEVANLVSQIILLGKRRKQVSRIKKEVKDVA
ncbi:MAG: hypothetical protein AB7N80_09270 [Bdellovibrionales bacterium]